MLTIFMYACEEDVHNPINTDDIIPSVVKDVSVENLSGAVTISYNIPDVTGLLYVKAVCEIKPGVTREVKASYYSSSLTIEGFGESKAYDVKLYSVGRNDKASDPVSVEVHPLTAPIINTFETLSMKEDWGGISFSFTNETEANLAIEVLTRDSLGNWISANTFYTSLKTGVFSVRGYEAEKREFGISIRDRWDNRSDTLIQEITPWYEELLDKAKFKVVNLPTDYNLGYLGNNLENIWDDYHGTPDYVSTPGYGLPQWFTFDMGTRAKLSRIVIHLRTYAVGGYNYLYNSGAVKKSDLYGSLNPNSDGSWESWTFLRECQSFKPSGLPAGQYTNEDIAYATAGEEFTFDGAPEVRYIRWKVLENWGGVTHANIDEIYIYGQPVEQ